VLADHSTSTWTADVKGSCVMAPVGIVDFCQFVDPGADRYCPINVCKVGDFGCQCKDNVCPAVEKIIGLFTIEGLWMIAFGILFVCSSLVGCCILSCCRQAPQRIIIVPYDLSGNAPVEAQPPVAQPEAYARFA